MSESQGQPSSSSAASSSAGAVVEVTVKTLDDREVRVRVGSEQRVQTIIDSARAELRNITGTHQRIIFGGRVLDSTSTIREAGITNGQTVHLVERGRSVANDRPNVQTQRTPLNMAPNQMMFQRMFQPNPLFEGLTPPAPPGGFTLIPALRVPPHIAGVPVIMSRYADDVITQKALPLRSRPGTTHQETRAPTMGQYLTEPNYIQWSVKIANCPMFSQRSNIEEMIKTIVRDYDGIPHSYRPMINVMWDQTRSSLSISIPDLPPHIPSPALEKLDFLALWTEHLKNFIDKIIEEDGLVTAVQLVLEMVQAGDQVDPTDPINNARRINRLDTIVKELELMWAGLSHQKDYERARFFKAQNQTSVYRQAKLEENGRSQRNPRFVMRHALDVDFLEVSREFRQQKLRFAGLEDLLDELQEAGALRYIRDSMPNGIDYRYRALSMYFCYMQRMRHQIAHMTHVCAEFDLPFMVPNIPQRLLPHHATNVVQVPHPHAATLILRFENPRQDDLPFETPIAHIVEPPRVLSDVTGRLNGDYPYLPFNPPSVHMEAVQQPPRRVPDPVAQAMAGMRRMAAPQFQPPAFAPPGPRPGPHQGFAYAGQDPITGAFNWFATPGANDPANILNYISSIRAGPEEVPEQQDPRPRRFVTTTGDAPSVPIETQPPPGAEPSRRYTNHRMDVQAEAAGPSTETLSSTPVQIEPSELQRIARNVASRYRNEALQRIATNLTTRFNDESWDTRLQNMPLCTLRECVSIALELLTSSGNSLTESRELMLALVRDEDVLVRAIAECVKSLFGRGEFPTHVSRIIMPRAETASSRNDYESVDHVDDAQSDEYDGMIVRVPSDISQPQSGDLRAIRERRQSRRQFLENRGRIPSTSSVASTSSSSATPGPSFNAEDSAEIRAGRLPLGNRPTTSRRTATPVARGESPNHIVIAATPNYQGFGLPIVGPSTSQIIPPPWEAPIMPIRQMVSPTPTTRALHDFDISDTSEHAPSPPAPTPRSAPATVTSSPTHEVEDPNESARQAARMARARIDHLAATFNGNLADSRRMNPFLQPGPTTPLDDPRRNTPRAQFVKPMVAIDPFMHCTNRHCEINRLSNPAQLAEMERYTLQSIRPDDEFAAHVQGLLPTGDRRPHQVPNGDRDYNYTILRNNNGDLGFTDLETFEKFIKTMIRSLLATCIDADTLHSMNMNQISHYPAANPADLAKIVKDHLNSAAERRHQPYSRWDLNPRNMTPEQHRERIETWNRNARAGMEVFANAGANIREQIAAQQPAVPPPPPVAAMNPGIDLEQEVLIPGQIASLLTQFVDYLDEEHNPRPPGLYKFLIDITHDRLTRHDFAQLARRSTASNVIAEYEGSIRIFIRERYLNGRTNHNQKELHRLACEHANTDEFFLVWINRLKYARAISPGMEQRATSWLFRQVEVSLIKAIFTLAQLDLDTQTVVEEVLVLFDNYLTRNLYLLFLLENRNMRSVKNNALPRISEYFATIRFQYAANHNGWQEWMGQWNKVLQYWFSKYKNINEPAVVDFFGRIGRVETNDGQYSAAPAPVEQFPPGAWPLPIAPHPNRGHHVPNPMMEVPRDVPSTSAPRRDPNATPLPIAPFPGRAGPSQQQQPVVNNNSRKRNHTGGTSSQPSDVDVDMVEPLMTSLSTSSPLQPGSSSDAPGPSS